MYVYVYIYIYNVILYHTWPGPLHADQAGEPRAAAPRPLAPERGTQDAHYAIITTY